MTAPQIDMRSDTVTMPSAEMLDAMVNAELGDDMSGEDPTVNRLEAMIAEMFGKEAAVFACSGTQSNQMGVRSHCQPGDEILIDERGHIANFEGGAPAVLSGATCRGLRGDHGMLDVDILDGNIRADDQHLCHTRLVCLENTTNAGGGYPYPLERLERISAWARDNDLKVHMDGARVFNAIVAQGYTTADLGQHIDTISICFSKGLGCPMGSILVGSTDEIYRARRSRKLFGGALRQAGVVAAAAVYALESNIDRLAEDHDNARVFAETISRIDGITIDPSAVESNLVFFDIDEALGTAAQLVSRVMEHGVRIGPSGKHRLRACTHLDVSHDDCLQAANAIATCVSEGFSEVEAATSGPYAR